MKKINQKITPDMTEVFKNNNAILQINLKNLKANFNYLQYLAPHSEIAACVKADCYGLGMHQICKILYKLKCKTYFVATLDEALSLRKKYKNINIYLLNGINDLNTYLKIKNLNIITVINNMYQYNILKSAYKFTKSKIKCCLHIDSGMNRLGFSLEDFIENLNNFEKYLEIKLIISHMINSEKKSQLNNKQLKLFKYIQNLLKKSKKNMRFSLGNSNAIFLGKLFHFDMLRSGGYIYGLDLSKKNKTKNVLTLKAKIIQIQHVKAGKSIGYGANYVTKRNAVIATLAIGYADGLPRNYDGYGYYKKTKVKFVGNISMDLSCVDISLVKNAKENDWIEIFGNNFSISSFAHNCKTIPYEISSKLGNRVKRIYNII